MKRSLIALSVVTALTTASFADEAELKAEIEALKEQLAKIEKKQDKSLKRIKKQVSEIKAHDGGDNLKFDVDFRTSMDYIEYKKADGTKAISNNLFSNRLWLGMAYAPSDNLFFRGRLSYNKAYGSPAMVDGMPQRGYGYDAFDWVINENLTDHNIRVREAYWLYKSSSLLGSDVSWTASFGRRPSTNGFLSALREDEAPQSPLGHIINVEFDGASFKFGLDKVTGVSGMYFKLCMGRGVSNANPRFTMSGEDYANDKTLTMKNTDLAGFIFVPYDDGQYKIMTTAFKAFNLPGMYADTMQFMGQTQEDMMNSMMYMPTSYNMGSTGDMTGAAISLMSNGIGDGISDFLDDTKVFASFAWSQTDPGNDLTRTITNTPMGDMSVQNVGMLGSDAKKSGTSWWIGTQMPTMYKGGKLGLEFNHGSKYWRSFTYAEDTLAGSKLATRGNAYEIYYTQPLMDALSLQVRYTHMDYKYTGSQGFFGEGGMPLEMDEAQAMGMNPVDEASDLRIYLRYRY